MRALGIYVARRLLLIPFSLAVLVTASFFLVDLIPGNPGQTILGQFATEEEVARLNHELGVDQPVFERYVNFISRLLQGDMGESFFTRRAVAEEIVKFLPNTIELAIPSLLLAVGLGTLVGTLGAYFRGGWTDKLTRSGTTLTQAVPDYVLALVLIFVVFFLLRLVPAPTGRLDVTDVYSDRVTNFLLLDTLLSGDFDMFGRALKHMILPVLTLGIAYSALFAKTVRTVMGEAMGSDQVEFARACGLPEWRVVSYALLESRTAILTYGAILFGALIAGQSIIEKIFAWPGIGRWALDSILKVDVPVIQAFVLIVGLATLLIYLALDVVVAALDPRTVRD